mgnify:CR=1 FL=1
MRGRSFSSNMLKDRSGASSIAVAPRGKRLSTYSFAFLLFSAFAATSAPQWASASAALGRGWPSRWGGQKETNHKRRIIIIGDSFTEGKSVHSNETISAVLRQPDLNVINVGKGGNGPMLELAALKEYAEFLKPKIVLWLYYVNDLNELSGEMESSLLRKYLDENDYSQNLIYRQEEIDDVLKNYVQVEWEKEKNEEKKKKITEFGTQLRPSSMRFL